MQTENIFSSTVYINCLYKFNKSDKLNWKTTSNKKRNTPRPNHFGIFGQKNLVLNKKRSLKNNLMSAASMSR